MAPSDTRVRIEALIEAADEVPPGTPPYFELATAWSHLYPLVRDYEGEYSSVDIEALTSAFKKAAPALVSTLLVLVSYIGCYTGCFQACYHRRTNFKFLEGVKKTKEEEHVAAFRVRLWFGRLIRYFDEKPRGYQTWAAMSPVSQYSEKGRVSPSVFPTLAPVHKAPSQDWLLPIYDTAALPKTLKAPREYHFSVSLSYVDRVLFRNRGPRRKP